MKKIIVGLSVMLLLCFIVAGCGSPASPEPSTAPSSEPSPAPSPSKMEPSPTPSSSGTEPTDGTPVYGGNFVEIISAGPQTLSYLPNMGPTDESNLYPGIERLVDAGWDGAPCYQPILDESYEIDPIAKTYTHHLRKNVYFHDGSHMTAEVVAWNIEFYREYGRFQNAENLESIEIVDDYTLVLHMTEFSNLLEQSWGWVPIFSKQAWENGGTTHEERVEWATNHLVATGPFILKEYKRDVHLLWEKNPNYWREGRPYLDTFKAVVIPDVVTAKAMMEAREADMWYGGSVTDHIELIEKGLIRKSYWTAFCRDIVPNTVDPDSVWQDKRLREAVEYALDKPAIAEALGKGFFIPLDTMAPLDTWGYDPTYKGRKYDPNKAKQLLVEAGYPDGLKIELLISNDAFMQDLGMAIKQYLDAVGFECELDVADPGRYWGSMFGAGWKDLIISIASTGIHQDEDYTSWFSNNPKAYMVKFKRDDPEKVALEKQCETTLDEKEREMLNKKLYAYLANEAFAIALFQQPSAYIIQPWVHTDFCQQWVSGWQTENTWMEKH
jgi:peptide/nickel transport system substrate-binding protein